MMITRTSAVAMAAGVALAIGGMAPQAHAQLLALYSFDDASFADISGNGYTPTNTNVTFASGGFEGGSAFFNGINSFLQIGLDINPTALPQLTMGCWVRVDDDFDSPIRQFISHDSGGFDRSLGIDFRGGLTGYSAFTGSGVLGGAPVVANEWAFVAVVYDQTAGSVTLHVNGSSFTTLSTAGSGNTFVRLGSNPAFGEFFGGQMDNAFFIRGALSPTEITRIREGGINAIIPTPTAAAGLAMLGVGGLMRRRR
ncbi:MAG: LamG-like jellyroll fold domain-containing protein [Phycisphaerales bacterium]|jgi:hypothetical protein|nr:LamG domain-containing protein [Phycisphaeraceae bacterium]